MGMLRRSDSISLDFCGIVQRPGFGNVMDRADEVIPRMARGQIPNPIFVAREIIYFEGELNG